MTSSENSELEIGFDPLRVCEAISKIGYEPYSAIMDIVDNSVSANASTINITMKLKEGKSLKNRNSVDFYQVVDNGKGMNRNEIKNAFKFGSQKNYNENSLSKYGMGLKSAGLSLGTKISIISKKDNKLSKRYTLDLDEIRSRNKLTVISDNLSDTEKQTADQCIPGESGTIVKVSGCENINQSSPGSTVKKLQQRLGVVYYSFLNRDKNPIKLRLRVSPNDHDAEFESIQPRDILFLDEAKNNTGWDPETYDYCSPTLVFDDKWDSFKDTQGNDLPPIQITAVAFPQAVMGQEKSPLPPDNKKKVRSYNVSRENSGFFIYRNGRLIRWGDTLKDANGDPIIGKDDINIRIRFEIQDEHDDVLHVDVSKQRLEIDDEALGNLERILKQAKRTAKSIRSACQEKVKVRDQEGASFTLTLTDVPEDDPQELGKGTPDKKVLERRRIKQEEATKELKSINDRETDPETEYDDVGFRKVRYSEQFPKRQLWKPFYDSVQGVYVYVNKTHPFYEEFLGRFEDGSAERLTFEALIFAIALGENNVFNYETNIPEEQLVSAFNRMHKNIDNFLVDWTFENQGEE